MSPRRWPVLRLVFSSPLTDARREALLLDVDDCAVSALDEDGDVVSLHFPSPAPHSGAAWERFIPRNEMDIAVTNAGAAVRFNGDAVDFARIAIGAVAPTALLVREAADALIGKPLTEDTIKAAGEAAKAAARPIDDMRGSIKQRKHLSSILVQRTLRKAAERARGN